MRTVCDHKPTVVSATSCGAQKIRSQRSRRSAKVQAPGSDTKRRRLRRSHFLPTDSNTNKQNFFQKKEEVVLQAVPRNLVLFEYSKLPCVLRTSLQQWLSQHVRGRRFRVETRPSSTSSSSRQQNKRLRAVVPARLEVPRHMRRAVARVGGAHPHILTFSLQLLREAARQGCWQGGSPFHRPTCLDRQICRIRNGV